MKIHCSLALLGKLRGSCAVHYVEIESGCDRCKVDLVAFMLGIQMRLNYGLTTATDQMFGGIHWLLHWISSIERVCLNFRNR